MSDNGEVDVSTPMFHLTASGSLMVLLLGIVATASAGYYMLDVQKRAVESLLQRVLDNQERIIASNLELACVVSLPTADRVIALQQDWCTSYLKKRFDAYKSGIPHQADLGG